MKKVQWMFWLALLVLMTQASVFGQTNTDEIVVVKKNGEKLTVSNPTVEFVCSGRFGSSCLPYKEVRTTDPVVPPKGITINKEPIELSKIKEITWIGVVGNNQKAKLVMMDGKEKEVFLFNGGDNSPLPPESIHIKGKTLVQGKEYDVTVECADATAIVFTRKK